MPIKGNRPPKGVLAFLYNTKLMTLTEIGKQYGVSRQRVFQWINYYGIERTQYRAIARSAKYSGVSKDELICYIRKGLSASSIGNKLGISTRTVIHLINEYELNEMYQHFRSMHIDFSKIPEKSVLEEAYTRNESLLELLQRFNCSRDTFYKWIDYYNIDNSGRRVKPRAKRYRSLPDKSEFKHDYMTMKLPELCTKYNCSTTLIYKWLKEYQIPNKGGRNNEQ